MNIANRRRHRPRPVLIRAHAARHAETFGRKQYALAVGFIAFHLRAACGYADIGCADLRRAHQRTLQRIDLPDRPAIAARARGGAFRQQRGFRLPRSQLPLFNDGKQHIARAHQCAHRNVHFAVKLGSLKTYRAPRGRRIQARRVHIVATQIQHQPCGKTRMLLAETLVNLPTQQGFAVGKGVN